jgi:hypothetical protein
MRLILGVVAVSVGLQVHAQGFEHYRKLFWDQLAGTCQAGLRWEKTVTEVDEDGGEKKETKVFDVDCMRGTATDGTQTIGLQPDEFSHLFEFAYDSPYYAPYLDIKEAPGGVMAHVKAGEEDKSKLRKQRFSVDETTGILLEAEAWIVKDSPLYDLEVHVTVWFDATGRYQRHAIETKTDVLLGGDMHTRIAARLVP